MATGSTIYACGPGKKLPRGSARWDENSIGVIALRLIAGEQLFSKISSSKGFSTKMTVPRLRAAIGDYDEVAFLGACFEEEDGTRR